MTGKLRNMTSIYYFFAIFYEEVSDDLVSNEGELKWFSLNKLDELEMSYTARYVMDTTVWLGSIQIKYIQA